MTSSNPPFLDATVFLAIQKITEIDKKIRQNANGIQKYTPSAILLDKFKTK